MKDKITLLFIVVGMTCLLGLTQFDREVWDVNAKLLEEKVSEMNESVETINLSELTPFEWDKVYFFYPYTPKETVYKTVGYEWDSISETVSEGMNQIVFLKKGTVVCYVYGYPANTGYGLSYTGGPYNDVASLLEINDDLLFEVKRGDRFIFLEKRL
ncbi:hypothetical protein IMZ08_17465 [Bacillus luteolus]|uniref:Cyclophilin-like domain-containing protein n=1 Tax=Litchfieldia luteola TaxID=682179 RepID=A0ABR9QN39_9BACI|nr:hypothetical protein [Cytobacillus luteolus]MBE4909826.1 hypothetical protein [Cytobacillus luteolus]MBP1942625.1 hypothetical protein [Cytobacillus luteolus]